MKSSVIVFPGSNCDRDIAVALEKMQFKNQMVWHKETSLPKSDLIVIPGGFSYGDYLRSGAIAGKSLIIEEVIKAANKGCLVLGICNGFQILTETGLLKGTLLRNKNLKFINKDVNIKVINNKTKFSSNYKKNQVLKINIAHNEGNYFTNSDHLKDLKNKKLTNNTYKFVYKILKKNEDLKPLYYSTLLHDIGKGSGDDHSKVGSRISSKVLKRLNENNSTITETRWLIENHLLMSDLAFKRDLGDFSVIKKAAKKINSMERLTNLFLLTALDISAVDQGLWNDWKARLLKTLYEKLEKEINRPSDAVSLNEKISLIKKDIIQNSKIISSSLVENVSKVTYPNYWLLQSKEMITFQIEKFFAKKKIDSLCEIRKRSTENFFSVIIFTKDRPQLFLDLISIFTSEKISIHQARIFTLADETVIDTFTISLNLNTNLIYNEKYLNELKQKLSLQKPQQFEETSEYNFSNRKFLKKKIEIFFDNKLSSTYTVLTVVTNDRLGLLYDLSKLLLKNKLVIFTAKISTNGDFVEDSFHLRTEYGSKFTSENKIKVLKSQIYKMLSQKLEYVY